MAVWTEDQVAALKALIVDGASAAEAARTLARRFDDAFSRTGVIGKAHRLKKIGFPQFGGGQGVRPAETAPAMPCRNDGAPGRIAGFKKVAPRLPSALPGDAAPEAGHSGVPLMALGAGACRFPVGEDAAAVGRHLFCGAARTAGSAYCRQHLALCTATAGERDAPSLGVA